LSGGGSLCFKEGKGGEGERVIVSAFELVVSKINQRTGSEMEPQFSMIKEPVT
jgi:hypothetical protein